MKDPKTCTSNSNFPWLGPLGTSNHIFKVQQHFILNVFYFFVQLIQTNRSTNKTSAVTVSSCGVSSHHLVPHVDLGEAEGAEMRVGALHGRLDGLPEQLVHELADERPHLLHRLREGQRGRGSQTQCPEPRWFPAGWS